MHQLEFVAHPSKEVIHQHSVPADGFVVHLLLHFATHRQ
jgi:hypothetical protein